MKLGWHWMSCERFTVLVGVDEHEIIRDGPPIVGRFMGQRLINLARWMRKLGGYQTCYLGPL